MRLNKSLWILIGIIITATFLRFYHIEQLAVFLSDQASDSTKTFGMLRGQFTLLGPITSVGGFYNGPIVYYLMLPFYWLFKGGMISGTVFQSTLSVLTIPILYLLAKKVFNERVGLISMFLFAISPLMIDYSRAAFNSYPAIFFSTLILYLLFSVHEKFSKLRMFLLGICLGFIFQMHYFTISLLFFSFAFPFLDKKISRSKFYILLSIGFVIGFSPFLIFEFRHQFLNARLLLNYLQSSNISTKSLGNVFIIWPEITAKLILGYHFYLGLLGFIGILFFSFYSYIQNKKIQSNLRLFSILFILVFIVGLVYGGVMQTHYVIAFHTSLIILAAFIIDRLFEKNNAALLVFCGLLIFVNASAWNIDKEKHPLQKGLAISDFKYAASIIHKNNKEKYNVGMHAQGDNRAMPLRYALNLLNETPVHYDNYRDIDSLYFIVRKDEPITSLKMWEYTSFGPSRVVKRWDINYEYFLYKLGK